MRPRTLDLAVVALLVVVLGGLYLATASRGPAQVNDTRAASVAAWSLGTRGTAVLPAGWPASRNYWGVETAEDRVLVGRFPGVAYWAAPAYAAAAIVGDEPPPAHPLLVDPGPAATTAALTAAAVAGVVYALLRTVTSRRVAVGATLVIATGTSLWSVAADAMWPHGPAMLALAGALLAWRRSHPALVAVCAAIAVLARPPVVVILCILAVYAWWRARPRDGWAFAAGAAAGLAALSAYSAWAFGTALPVAGYDAVSHLDGLAIHGPWQTARELGLAFVSRSRGLLVASPVVLPAMVAVVVAWRRLPGWTRAGAVAGLVLLVLQVRAVGHRGGADLAAYRVSLEALVVATPALVLATVEVARDRRWVQVLVGILAAASIAFHAHGAVTGGIAPQHVRAWERIDVTVRAQYGNARLGEVDLRSDATTDP